MTRCVTYWSWKSAEPFSRACAEKQTGKNFLGLFHPFAEPLGRCLASIIIHAQFGVSTFKDFRLVTVNFVLFRRKASRPHNCRTARWFSVLVYDVSKSQSYMERWVYCEYYNLIDLITFLCFGCRDMRMIVVVVLVYPDRAHNIMVTMFL